MLPFDVELKNDFVIAVPPGAGFYPFPELTMKWDLGLTNEVFEKSLSHVKVFDVAPSCVTFLFDYAFSNWKREEKRILKERCCCFKAYKIKLVALILSECDSFVSLKKFINKRKSYRCFSKWLKSHFYESL